MQTENKKTTLSKKKVFIRQREFYIDGGVIRITYENEGRCQIEINSTDGWEKFEQEGKIILARKEILVTEVKERSNRRKEKKQIIGLTPLEHYGIT